MIVAATYAAAAAVMCIGAYGLLVRRNLIHICMSISIMETAAILLVVLLAYDPAGSAPILDPEVARYVDPLPHALALTAIVIAAAVTALGLALAVIIHRRLGTLRIDELPRLLR